MKNIKGLFLTLSILLVSGSGWAKDARFNVGLYVVVDNMNEAKQFYSQVFETAPAIDNGDFVGFSLGGNLFSLFAKTSFEHDLQKGNNVVPYIRVNNIEQEFSRVKALGAGLVHDHVLDEDQIKLFMFTDPSGNPIEFYELKRSE